MSRTVDERVVQARFDNSQFDKNIEQSMSTLDKFKQSLKLDDSAKSFNELEKASSKLDLSHLEKSVDKLTFRFSALGETVHNVFVNMINQATAFSKKFTIDPVKMGLSEYEQKMDSIKLAMANTGAPLEDVKRTLEDLNIYADKTIYKFQDMTSNLGKFTAQGIGLEDSAAAIKGIANLAAVTGANTEAASRAMYNFSQAMAIGKMELRDWRTMENTGMGNKEFREQLIQAAKDLGYFDREWRDGQNHVISGTQLMTEAMSSFRETLKYGWMDNELMLETLRRYSGDAKDAAGNIYAIGKKASEAATEITTFSKLIDVVQESFQSQWAYVWEIIIGDYEQAKRLWTSVGIEISGIVDNMFSNLRSMLKEWDELGGRVLLLDTFKNAWENLKEAIEAFKSGLADIIPPMTAEKLLSITNTLHRFVDNTKLSEKGVQILRNAGRMLGVVLTVINNGLDLTIKILKPVGQIINILIGLLSDVIDHIYNVITGEEKLLDVTGAFSIILEILKDLLTILIGVVMSVVGGIKNFIDQAMQLEIVQTIVNDIKNAFIELGKKAAPVLETVGGGLLYVIDQLIKFGQGNYIQNGINKLDEVLTNFYFTIKSGKGFVTSFFSMFKRDGRTAGDKALDLAQAFTTLSDNANAAFGKTGGVTSLVDGFLKGMNSLGEVADGITEVSKKYLTAGNIARAVIVGLSGSLIGFLSTGASLMNTFRRTFKGVPGLIFQLTNATKALVVQFKVQAIVKITGCIIALAAALVILSKVSDPKDIFILSGALTVLVVAIAKVASAMGLVSDIEGPGIQAGANALLKMSGAVLIMAAALRVLEGVEVGKGLIVRLGILAGIMLALVGLGKVISMVTKNNPLTNGGGVILTIAASMIIMVGALKRLEKLDLEAVKAAMPVLLECMVGMGAVAFLAGNVINAFAGLSFVLFVGGILMLVEGFNLIGHLDYHVLNNIKAMLDKIKEVLLMFAVLTIVFTVAKLLLRVSRAVKALGSIVDGIKDGLLGIGDKVKNAVKYFGLAADIVSLALLIGSLVLFIKTLGEMEVQDLDNGIRALERTLLCITMVVGVLEALSAILGNGLGVNLAGIGVLAIGITYMVSTFAQLAQLPNVDWDWVQGWFLGVMTVIVILEVVLGALGAKFSTSLSLGMKTALSIAALIGVLTICIGLLTMMQDQTLAALFAAGELAIIMSVMTAMIYAMSQINTKDAAITAGGIAVMLGSLIAAILVLDSIQDWAAMRQKLAEAVIAVGMLGLIADAISVLGGKGGLGSIMGAASIAILAGAIVVLAGACMMLNTVDATKLGSVLFALGGFVTLVSGITAVLSLFGPAAAIGAASFAIIAGAVAVFSVAAIAFAYAAGMFAEALANMTGPLDTLIKLGPSHIAELGAGLIVLATSGALCGAAAIPILSFAAAVGALHLAIYGLGDELTKLGTGFINVSVGISALNIVSTDGLITKMAKLAIAVAELALSANDAVKIGQGYEAAARGLRDFNTDLENVAYTMETASVTIREACKVILESLQSLSDLGLMIDEILEATSKLGAQIVMALMEDINKFANNQLPSSGVVAIEAFSKGFTDSIPSTSEYIAKWLVGGLQEGIDKYGSQIYGSGFSFGMAVKNGLCDCLGIHSNSDETIDMVYWMAGGANEGNEKYKSLIEKAGSGFGETELLGLYKSLDKADNPADHILSTSNVQAAKTVADDKGGEIGEVLGDAVVEQASGTVMSFLQNIGASIKSVIPQSLQGTSPYVQSRLDALSQKQGAVHREAIEYSDEELAAMARRQKSAKELEDQYGILAGATEAATESTKKNSEAEDENADATGNSGKAAKDASESMDELAQAEERLSHITQVLGEKFKHLYTDDFLTKLGEKSHKALEAMGTDVLSLSKMYGNMFDKMTSMLDNIFDDMSDIEFMDKDALLDNMQDHLDVVNNWADEMEYLASKVGSGFNAELYEKLANLGPDGWKYVHAFTTMTDEELSRASNMFSQSLVLPQQRALDITASYLNVGMEAVAGYENGLRNNLDGVISANEAMGKAGVDALRTEIDSHSPSRVYESIGLDAINGFGVGICNNIPIAEAAVSDMAFRTLNVFANKLLYGNPSAKTIAQDFMAQFAAGMVFSNETLNRLIAPILQGIVTAINAKVAEIRQNGSNICKHLVAGFKDEMKEQQENIQSAIDSMFDMIEKAFKKSKNQSKIEKLARWLVEVFCTELKNKNTTQKKIKKTLEELFEEMYDDLKDTLEEQGKQLGLDFVNGYILGLEDAEAKGRVAEAAGALAEAALEAIAAAQESASPSKKAMRKGKDLDDGYAIGIENNIGRARKAAKRLADETIDELDGSMSRLQDHMTEVLNVSIEKSFSNTSISNTSELLKNVADIVNVSSSTFVKLTKNLSFASNVTKQVAEQYIDSYFKMADATVTATKKSYKALETFKQRSAKSAKQISESFNKIVPYKLKDGIVKAFVPISEVAEETAENVSNASTKMAFKIGKNVKDVGAHINKAISFAKNLNTVMMDHRGSDTLLKSLANINKYFVKFKQGKVPDKVITFLDNLKTEMAPVNDLVDGMAKKFYGVNDALKKHSRASNDARTGLIRFAEKIFESTKVGEEYKKLQEEIAKAEEELAEARADYAKAQEEQNFNGWKSSKTRREEEEKLEEEYGKVLEKEEALAELRAKEVPYVNALSNAIKEYRENLSKTLISQRDFYNAVDKTSGAIDPSKLVGNVLNFNTALRDYRKGLISLAGKGLNADVMQALVEGGVNSIGKINSWNKLDKRTIQLINQVSANAQKKADKAAKAAVESVSKTLTDSTIKAQKKFNKQMNEGDKAFKKILKGQIEYFSQTVQQFGIGSKQVDTLLTHMRGAFADLEPVMNLAGETFHDVTDAFSRNDEIAVNLFGSIDKLSDVFGINAEKAGDAGEMIAQMTEQLQAYGESVKSALSLSNPFEKFEATEGITKDQLLYNVQSMRDAQVQYEQVYNNLVNRGVAPEILAKMETMGISQGLAYGKALLESTDEELGYFNDVVVQNLKFSEEQEKKAQARMLEACGPLAEAIRKGLNAAFKKNGVTIPLTDPSKVEEQKEEASDAGYDVGESYGDSINDAVEDAGEESMICYIEGSNDSLQKNEPQLINVGRKAAKRIAKGSEEYLSSDEFSNKISSATSKSMGNAIETSVTASTESATNGAYQTIKTFGNNSESYLSNSFKKAAEDSVKSFQSAIDKINQLIQGINTDITIHVNADMSAAQAALDAFNASKSVSMGNAYTTSTAVASSTPAVTWNTIDGGSAAQGNTTNVTFNQYNSSPKALDAVEIYRQTQKLTNQTNSLIRRANGGL